LTGRQNHTGAGQAKYWQRVAAKFLKIVRSSSLPNACVEVRHFTAHYLREFPWQHRKDRRRSQATFCTRWPIVIGSELDTNAFVHGVAQCGDE
jgi:hypothetical protein